MVNGYLKQQPDREKQLSSRRAISLATGIQCGFLYSTISSRDQRCDLLLPAKPLSRMCTALVANYQYYPGHLCLFMRYNCVSLTIQPSR